MSWLLYVFVISSSPPPFHHVYFSPSRALQSLQMRKAINTVRLNASHPYYIRAHSFKKVKLAPPCFLLGSNPFRVVCPSVNVFDVRHLKCVETPALTPTPKYLMVCIVYSLFPFFPSLHHCFSCLSCHSIIPSW